MAMYWFNFRSIRQINQVQTEQATSNAVNVFVINNMTIKYNYHGINKYNIKNVECFMDN